MPNAGAAVVDTAKLTEYLLSPTHPVGRAKAEFFKRFGFAQERHEGLRVALLKHGATRPIVRTETSEHAEGLGFNLGNAFKYMFRAGKKTGESWLEDAKKSRFYLVRWVGGDIIGAGTNDHELAFDAGMRRNLAGLASVEDACVNNIEMDSLHDPKEGHESALATDRLFGVFVNALLELEDKNHIPIAVFMDLLNTKIHMIETFAKANIAIPQ